MDTENQREEMATGGTSRKVWLVCSGKRSAGEVRIQRWSSSARLTRGAKALGLMWGLAIASIIVPFAHFFLVPAFLVAGPIVAYFIGRQRSTVLGGTGKCPACDAPFVIGKCTEAWPIDDVCEKCRKPVRIDLA